MKRASVVAQKVEESACNAGDLGLIPGQGRPPGEGNGNCLAVSHCAHCSLNPG